MIPWCVCIWHGQGGGGEEEEEEAGEKKKKSLLSGIISEDSTVWHGMGERGNIPFASFPFPSLGTYRDSTLSGVMQVWWWFGTRQVPSPPPSGMQPKAYGIICMAYVSDLAEHCRCKVGPIEVLAEG